MKVVIAFIVSGLGGEVLSAAWALYKDDGTVISAGASGAVCGMLGLLLAHMRTNESRHQMFMPT